MPINASGLKSIWPWLVEPLYAWLCAEVIFIALLICFTLTRAFGPNTTEFFIRYTGLFLQIAGLYTVIWGISKTRALFGHPSFLSAAKEWLTRFPLLRRDISISLSNGMLLADTLKGRMRQTHAPGANPTIEDRLDSLEKNVALIHESISQTQIEMDGEFEKI